MNILWLTQTALTEARQLMNKKTNPFVGWLESASAHLADSEGINLSVAFPENRLTDVQVINGNKIKYYVFPPVSEKYDPSRENVFLKKILNYARPDIVNIFGSEHAHSLAMVRTCNEQNIPVVLSFQGIISMCARHYMAYLPARVRNGVTFGDLIYQGNLRQEQGRFFMRGRSEIEAVRKVRYVIGRTALDRAFTTQINPGAKYYFCNETLRDEFYKHGWDIDRCEKHSIFISQAGYPIKGLHLMLEAMPLILRRFPDARIYVAGLNIIKSETLKDKLKLTSYGKYIKALIKRYDLGESVEFTGILDERQMCRRYLQSHVFVCASSIENSPNSLGEAMILGVPCVASDVGGVTDLLTHKEEGFVYQADAPYMLAHYVCEVFANDELAGQFSAKAREHALRTHDREVNTHTLISIYNDIRREA